MDEISHAERERFADALVRWIAASYRRKTAEGSKKAPASLPPGPSAGSDVMEGEGSTLSAL